MGFASYRCRLDSVDREGGLMAKIVSNASQGYGYNYAALSDIAMQGYEIPKMKTGTEGEREYVYYFDKDVKEWVRGAEIVLPDSKGMNKAQLYGSALTYARRYTTLMALSLACEDDKKIEALKADGTKKTEADVTISKYEWDLLNKSFSKEEIKAMYTELGISKGTDIPLEYYNKKMKEKEEKDKGLLQEKPFY